MSKSILPHCSLCYCSVSSHVLADVESSRGKHSACESVVHEDECRKGFVIVKESRNVIIRRVVLM